MTQKIYCVVEEVKKDLTSFNIEDGDAIVDMKEFSDYLNKELSFKVNIGCLVVYPFRFLIPLAIFWYF